MGEQATCRTVPRVGGSLRAQYLVWGNPKASHVWLEFTPVTIKTHLAGYFWKTCILCRDTGVVPWVRVVEEQQQSSAMEESSATECAPCSHQKVIEAQNRDYPTYVWWFVLPLAVSSGINSLGEDPRGSWGFVDPLPPRSSKQRNCMLL